MRTFRWFTAVTATFVLSACSSGRIVQVPPKVDLAQLGTVGLIEISSGPDQALGREANRRLLSAIQTAQPGVPVLELGGEGPVLGEVGAGQLDPESARALGERHGVDVLLWGVLETKESRPTVSLGPGLESLKAKTELEASLHAKLIDTGSGATLWTSAANERRTLASLSVSQHGISGQGSASADEALAELLDELVQQTVTDFRPRWTRVKD